MFNVLTICNVLLQAYFKLIKVYIKLIKTLNPSLREPINNYISKTNCKPFQGRDFRRTFRIMGRTLGIPKSHLDAIQHHRIYNDSEEINHWQEKQEAMEKWCDKLKTIY